MSLAWKRERPIKTPWGSERIPANRKPRWFCATPLDHPENAVCKPTEDDCKAQSAGLRVSPSPGAPPEQVLCEPHAMAACSASLGACYPTIAICESAQKLTARDQGSNRTRAPEPAGACAWQAE